MCNVGCYILPLTDEVLCSYLGFLFFQEQSPESRLQIGEITISLKFIVVLSNPVAHYSSSKTCSLPGASSCAPRCAGQKGLGDDREVTQSLDLRVP